MFQLPDESYAINNEGSGYGKRHQRRQKSSPRSIIGIFGDLPGAETDSQNDRHPDEKQMEGFKRHSDSSYHFAALIEIVNREQNEHEDHQAHTHEDEPPDQPFL